MVLVTIVSSLREVVSHALLLLGFVDLASWQAKKTIYLFQPQKRSRIPTTTNY